MITNHDYDNRNIFIISIDHNLKCESIIDQNTTGKRYDGFSRTFISEIIDRLGVESSRAQKLQIPITTTTKFTSDTNDDLIYLMFARSLVSKQSKFKEIGFIRFGKRDLYFDDGTSLKHLVNCPSILDFYIRFKRNGYGKILFDLMLKRLSINPKVLAYDRPSYSMLSFLRRHYSLDQPLWQHNHFVIFSNDIFSL
ncbi:Alpha-tubulin N-acetyltransferase 1 [Dermatophagoides pteronyssinus]|uniref:Alpha-tubulin N-acetyltransferase-like n=2 Tax=Dermatophagoides pteronyssinus TaxID=6956 RepID=A0A6P6YGS1_DERPT|nr:alpha-tubulin N-acetyltransferase-like [Dermatophagoides pteronyssinus]KAH9417335.1 Alpha-tubulin N-acetyltransferase 1 [Dermatophagoides pteronyssinus]